MRSFISQPMDWNKLKSLENSLIETDFFLFLICNLDLIELD